MYTSAFEGETALPPLGKTPIDQATLNELRSSKVLWLFAFVFFIGLGIASLVQYFPQTFVARSLALLLMIMPLVAWVIQENHYQTGIWLIAGSCFIAILVTQFSFPTSVSIMALAFPVGLIGFFISRWAGLFAAAGSTVTLLILANQHYLPPQLDIVYIALLLIWGMVLLYWLALDPLYTVAQWSWYYYLQATNHAEAARERQLELAMAVSDLAEVNRQLEYLNRVVRAAHREVEEAGRTKMEFVANVSHELRTPLNMIIGFSEILIEAPRIYQTTLPPSMMADIAAIYRNGCHLQNLIDDVLDLSQIDMRRMALSKERSDIQTLITEAIEAVRFLYESKQLTLSAELPPALPEILCDRTRIREVLLNLLSNAGRFAEQGGAIVRAATQGDRLVVSVTDSGPGIAPGQLKRLFEPFQQLDSTIRRRYGGSGLGLAISRAFIEMHGGSMWAESELDRGSTFSFRCHCPMNLLPMDNGVMGKRQNWLDVTSNCAIARPEHRLSRFSLALRWWGVTRCSNAC